MLWIFSKSFRATLKNSDFENKVLHLRKKVVILFDFIYDFLTVALLLRRKDDRRRTQGYHEQINHHSNGTLVLWEIVFPKVEVDAVCPSFQNN